jgi:hypothetical protein
MNKTPDLDKKLLNDIEVYGWHVIKIQEDDLGPSYAHTIGLFHTFSHPEIIIVGLELDTLHFLINRLGDAIREGVVFESGQFYSNIINGVDCYFTTVAPEYYSEYVGYAESFYQGANFPLQQCIYPTISGIYPWQPNWPSELKNLQPILGPIPVKPGS